MIQVQELKPLHYRSHLNSAKQGRSQDFFRGTHTGHLAISTSSAEGAFFSWGGGGGGGGEVGREGRGMHPHAGALKFRVSKQLFSAFSADNVLQINTLEA